jgi:glucose-1-phosphate cytidylyltransferase
MQVVVLCGGRGTRLSEHTSRVPKPLIEIGGKPILWHIIQVYKSFGFTEFILCLGYKGDKIKEYFGNEADVDIRFVETGLDSNKAERLIKVKGLIEDDNFIVTYGDDLSDVNIGELHTFHKKHKKIVTLTAVSLESPFGVLDLNNSDEVTGFREKPRLDYYMNGGFYIFNKKIFSYMGKGRDLESETLPELAKLREIVAFKHNGFWKSMNTLKDVIELNEIYDGGNVPWIR